MPTVILGLNLIATKLASGAVRLQFLDVNSASLRFEAVLSSADVTAINTTVNGGSTGANLTFIKAQDANKGDYDKDHYQGH